jgi:hypothetical protein
MKRRRYALIALGLPAVSLVIPLGTAGAVVTHPNANIALNTKSRPVYKPSKLNVTVGVGTCTQTNYTFKITNETAVTQQMELNSNPFGGPLAPEAVQKVCVGSGTIVFSLASNPNARLTVTGTAGSAATPSLAS